MTNLLSVKDKRRFFKIWNKFEDTTKLFRDRGTLIHLKPSLNPLDNGNVKFSQSSILQYLVKSRQNYRQFLRF